MIVLYVSLGMVTAIKTVLILFLSLEVVSWQEKIQMFIQP